MPCILAVLILLTPRLAVALLWYFTHWFDGLFPSLLLPILGFLFLPWTLLAYLVAWQPVVGIQGIGWVVVGLGFLVDMSAYGGGYGNRRRISDYRRR